VEVPRAGCRRPGWYRPRARRGAAARVRAQAPAAMEKLGELLARQAPRGQPGPAELAGHQAAARPEPPAEIGRDGGKALVRLLWLPPSREQCLHAPSER